MKVLITGAGGQLGRELRYTAPEQAEVHALHHGELDIADRDRVRAVVRALAPDLIFNAAAYTAVDRAESDPETAHAANAEGPGHLAEAARTVGARLVHVSTDFVFSGAQCRPYRPDDDPDPLSVYGRSKRAGEVRVLASGCEALIVRASWIYARAGENFVNTMLRLMGEREALRVVADQFGAPTWARGLARALWSLGLQRDPVGGILHYCDAGSASWFDFAVAIGEEARAAGRLARLPQILPITTAEYPLPAQRPRFSLLDCGATWSRLGLDPVHWRVRLREMLHEPEAP